MPVRPAITRMPWARRIGSESEKEMQRYASEQQGLTGQPLSEQSLAAMTYGLTQAELAGQEEHQRQLEQKWLQKKQLEMQQNKGGGLGSAIFGGSKILSTGLGVAGLLTGNPILSGIGAIIGSGGAAIPGMIGQKNPMVMDESGAFGSTPIDLRKTLPAIGGGTFTGLPPVSPSAYTGYGTNAIDLGYNENTGSYELPGEVSNEPTDMILGLPGGIESGFYLDNWLYDNFLKSIFE